MPKRISFDSAGWIIGGLTSILLLLGGWVWASLDARVVKTENISSQNTTDIAVLKTVVVQTNNRTYDMDTKLDNIQGAILSAIGPGKKSGDK